MTQQMQEAIDGFERQMFEYEQYLSSVRFFFEKHPHLNVSPLPIVHSIKHRLKERSHLIEKLERKLVKGIVVDGNNFSSEITDFIGVRVLHLHQDQFPVIDSAIKSKVNNGDWAFVEPPKAYTWDPESINFYQGLGLATELRETYYTSIHYLVKPNNQNTVCCEIQVRTLFEEIWGEIDHSINYPVETDSIACKEQLRVLSKLVSTGTRLADSIFRSHNDYQDRKRGENIE